MQDYTCTYPAGIQYTEFPLTGSVPTPTDRWQTFCTGGSQSAAFAVDCSVPQGCGVLGPVELSLTRKISLNCSDAINSTTTSTLMTSRCPTMLIPVSQAGSLLRPLADCVSEVRLQRAVERDKHGIRMVQQSHVISC